MLKYYNTAMLSFNTLMDTFKVKRIATIDDYDRQHLGCKYIPVLEKGYVYLFKSRKKAHVFRAFCDMLNYQFSINQNRKS